MMGDPRKSRFESDLADPSPQKISPPQSGLDRFEPPHRWRLGQLIDRPGQPHALQMHGRKQKRVENLLVIKSLQALQPFQGTTWLENRMRTVHHGPSLKENLIGIRLVEHREMNPVGAKFPHDDRPSFGQDSSSRNGTSTDSTTDLTDFESTTNPGQHECSLAIIDQSTGTSHRTAFSTMSTDELPDGLVGAPTLGGQMTGGLIGGIALLNHLKSLPGECLGLIGSHSREGCRLLETIGMPFTKT